jgi:ubiquinone/menaquinone biosynthesis C-methylase UbiE
MVSPIRKLYHNPDKILKPFIVPGMNILELGPAMGFFSLPMARLAGTTGKVYCVDIQPEMLDKLNERAEQAGLSGQIETRVCMPTSLLIEDLSNKIDFVLLFAMVHEVPDQKKLFAEVSRTLKPGSKVLFAEPKGHVKRHQFEESIHLAQSFDLIEKERIGINKSHSVILEKEIR